MKILQEGTVFGAQNPTKMSPEELQMFYKAKVMQFKMVDAISERRARELAYEKAKQEIDKWTALKSVLPVVTNKSPMDSSLARLRRQEEERVAEAKRMEEAEREIEARAQKFFAEAIKKAKIQEQKDAKLKAKAKVIEVKEGFETMTEEDDQIGAWVQTIN